MKICFVRAMALLPEFDGALDIFEHAAMTLTRQLLFGGMLLEPNLSALREHPRFKAAVAVAEARFAAERTTAKASVAAPKDPLEQRGQ